jgi:predicted nucleic acid-binding protein
VKERLFLDTNVVLDLLGERVSFYESMARIASMADRREIRLVTSALSFPTIYYILTKFESRAVVLDKLQKFKVLTEVADLTDHILGKGLASQFSDFEDSIQYFCALQSKCNLIITRDFRGFKGSAIPVMTPDEYLASRSTG